MARILNEVIMSTFRPTSNQPIVIRGQAGDPQSDRRLLEGPRSRITEFLHVVRIGIEFIRGYQALHWLGPCVTVFGSARFGEGHPYYDLARQAGAEMAKASKPTNRTLCLAIMFFCC